MKSDTARWFRLILLCGVPCYPQAYIGHPFLAPYLFQIQVKHTQTIGSGLYVVYLLTPEAVSGSIFFTIFSGTLPDRRFSIFCLYFVYLSGALPDRRFSIFVVFFGILGNISLSLGPMDVILALKIDHEFILEDFHHSETFWCRPEWPDWVQT